MIPAARAGRSGFVLEKLESRVLLAGTTADFAVIGDFGSGTANEGAVANLVKSWNPEFIVTTGDNNYEFGEASTIDANIGQFYHEYIYNYQGGYGAGSPRGGFSRCWETTTGATFPTTHGRQPLSGLLRSAGQRALLRLRAGPGPFLHAGQRPQ